MRSSNLPLRRRCLSRASLQFAAIALASFWGVGSLHADPTRQATATEYRSIYRGVTLGAGFEVAPFGQAIPGTAGAQTAGVKSFAGRQLLLTWDVAGGATGGYGGNEHPGFLFVGGLLDLSAELGYRFLSESAFGPYAGAGAEFAFSAVGIPSAPAGGLAAMNNLDGLAGENGRLATRYNVGGSYLTARQSLEVTAFAQEALRAPASWATSAVYYEVGAHAQYDLSQRLTVVAEALYGKTGKKSERIFGSTTQANHMEFLLAVRTMLSKGFWVAFNGRATEDGNTTTYAASPIVYVTSRPLSLSVGLVLGIPVE